jgi:hypothetical protein
MIGTKTLSEIRDELRIAFAKQGIDLEAWIAEVVDQLKHQRSKRDRLEAEGIELGDLLKQKLSKLRTQRAKESDQESPGSLHEFLKSSRAAMEKERPAAGD